MNLVGVLSRRGRSAPFRPSSIERLRGKWIGEYVRGLEGAIARRGPGCSRLEPPRSSNGRGCGSRRRRERAGLQSSRGTRAPWAAARIGMPLTYSITNHGRPVGGARVEHLGDVRVVHHRQRLALGLRLGRSQAAWRRRGSARGPSDSRGNAPAQSARNSARPRPATWSLHRRPCQRVRTFRTREIREFLEQAARLALSPSGWRGAPVCHPPAVIARRKAPLS